MVIWILVDSLSLCRVLCCGKFPVRLVFGMLTGPRASAHRSIITTFVIFASSHIRPSRPQTLQEVITV